MKIKHEKRRFDLINCVKKFVVEKQLKYFYKIHNHNGYAAPCPKSLSKFGKMQIIFDDCRLRSTLLCRLKRCKRFLTTKSYAEWKRSRKMRPNPRVSRTRIISSNAYYDN